MRSSWGIEHEGDVVTIRKLSFHYSELLSDIARQIAKQAKNLEDATRGACFVLDWLGIASFKECMNDLLPLAKELKKELEYA